MTAPVPDVAGLDLRPPPPKVLAFDLSMTCTGIATPDGDLWDYTPGPASRGDIRLAFIRNMVRDYVTELAPTVVTIEGPVTRSQAATIIGMIHGAIRVELIDRGVPYLIVPPAALKKYATGKGNSDKSTMRMALYKRTDIDEPDDNRVDAAWLRYLTLDLYGHPAFGIPQHHRTALDTLNPPKAGR